MAKYKVKVIGHLCKNNYQAKYGEVIDESQLTADAQDLADAGFIELVEEVETKEEDSFDLDKLTLAELKDFAKANDLVVTQTTKAKILDEIERQISDKLVVDVEEVKED